MKLKKRMLVREPESSSEMESEEEEERRVGKPSLVQMDDQQYSEQETDSETEALQEAFATGALKPGLNVPVKRKRVNQVGSLKAALAAIRLELPWLERLDSINKPADIAPELAFQLSELEQKPHNKLVHDDLKRESLFYRQAQRAVLDALPVLRQAGIRTQRPDDYFAQMAKSDEHMLKVKQHLIKEKTKAETVEKVRQIRKQKKLQKALQAESKVAKVNAKRQMLDQVKKFRKGQSSDLGFLDNKPSHKVGAKREYKNSRFGMGGKKRGLKKNTRASTYQTEDKGKGQGKGKRPGKARRKQLTGKRKQR